MSITVRMEYLFNFQFWYCELCEENRWGGGRKYCFVNFCSLALLQSSMNEGSGVGKKVLFRGSWNRTFPNRDLSRSNKHDIFWHVISTGYLYVLFLSAIAVSDFLPLEMYKKLGPPLSRTTFTANSHAEFICFKYYTAWNQFFLIKIHIKGTVF